MHIRAVHAETRGAYGWPRIWRELRKRGVRVGKQRVQRLMQAHGIRARGKRRFRVVTTDSRHSLPVAPNRLERNFSPPRPDTAWSGDITYIARSILPLTMPLPLSMAQNVGQATRGRKETPRRAVGMQLGSLATGCET